MIIFLFVSFIYCITINSAIALPLDKQIYQPYSKPLENDNYEVFLDGLTASANNIYQFELLGLTQGRTDFEPWAASYWPIYLGILGNRYADSDMHKSKRFSDNYSTFLSYPAEFYLANQQIYKLSPAEKYDLLVGDHNWTLTKAMWQRGRDDMDSGGVANWTGICHGWSAAAHMGVKEAQKSVKVLDVTGTYQIEFYADDIQGLESYLWAKSSPITIQAGSRCKQDSVVRDPYLRPVDPACLNLNPMTWHMVILNRVGISQKSFVMDSSSGPEVWNYPISSYDYSYFNPRTFETTHLLKAAIEPIQNLNTDKYRTYRNPMSKFVVGIVMDIFHPELISAQVGNSNGPNAIQTETYIYDLELDENYNIIGGEWYSKSRPDFLWTFPAGSQAIAREDLAIQNLWDTKLPLPKDYSDQARSASQHGRVLSKIVNTLLNESLIMTDDVVNPIQ